MPSPQNGIIMKTIMTFSMDENGQVEITTGNEDLFDTFFSLSAGEKAEKHFRDLMARMVGKDEKYLNQLKSFYGFNPKKVVRPMTFGNASFFQIGKPNGYPWRGGK